MVVQKKGSIMSFLERIEIWVAAGITGLISWLWIYTMGRIKNLEDSVIKRDEFDKYAERVDKARDEMRDSIVKLFDKMDDLKTTIIGRNDHR